ncbi:hypothetical protein HKX48_005123 [Thoreauomyces humboldtii]|nr:hypothetical protein HKX48_005123 [Thoreauomyces humboldtii]
MLSEDHQEPSDQEEPTSQEGNNLETASGMDDADVVNPDTVDGAPAETIEQDTEPSEEDAEQMEVEMGSHVGSRKASAQGQSDISTLEDKSVVPEVARDDSAEESEGVEKEAEGTNPPDNVSAAKADEETSREEGLVEDGEPANVEPTVALETQDGEPAAELSHEVSADLGDPAAEESVPPGRPEEGQEASEVPVVDPTEMALEGADARQASYEGLPSATNELDGSTEEKHAIAGQDGEGSAPVADKLEHEAELKHAPSAPSAADLGLDPAEPESETAIEQTEMEAPLYNPAVDQTLNQLALEEEAALAIEPSSELSNLTNSDEPSTIAKDADDGLSNGFEAAEQAEPLSLTASAALLASSDEPLTSNSTGLTSSGEALASSQADLVSPDEPLASSQLDLLDAEAVVSQELPNESTYQETVQIDAEEADAEESGVSEPDAEAPLAESSHDLGNQTEGEDSKDEEGDQEENAEGQEEDLKKEEDQEQEENERQDNETASNDSQRIASQLIMQALENQLDVLTDEKSQLEIKVAQMSADCVMHMETIKALTEASALLGADLANATAEKSVLYQEVQDLTTTLGFMRTKLEEAEKQAEPSQDELSAREKIAKLVAENDILRAQKLQLLDKALDLKMKLKSQSDGPGSSASPSVVPRMAVTGGRVPLNQRYQKLPDISKSQTSLK